MASEAQKRAVGKYLSEKVEEFKVRVPKGQKQRIKDHAAGRNKSLNQYILDLIAQDMGE